MYTESKFQLIFIIYFTFTGIIIVKIAKSSIVTAPITLNGTFIKRIILQRNKITTF